MVSKRGRKFSELSYLNGWPRLFLFLYLIGIDPTIFHLNPPQLGCAAHLLLVNKWFTRDELSFKIYL